MFVAEKLSIQARSNKSLDASGGSVFPVCMCQRHNTGFLICVDLRIFATLTLV